MHKARLVTLPPELGLAGGFTADNNKTKTRDAQGRDLSDLLLKIYPLQMSDGYYLCHRRRENFPVCDTQFDGTHLSGGGAGAYGANVLAQRRTVITTNSRHQRFLTVGSLGFTVRIRIDQWTGWLVDGNNYAN